MEAGDYSDGPAQALLILGRNLRGARGMEVMGIGWLGGRTLAVATAAATLRTAAAAEPVDIPFAVGNRNPLVQIYALPGLGSGSVLEAGERRWLVALEAANSYSQSRSDNEAIELDGETHRLDLGASVGLGNGFEIGIALPFIQHSGGELDGFVEGWHDVFGLPDGGRPQAPRDQLRYHYQRDGITVLDFDDDTGGVGDLQLSAAQSLWRSADSAASIRLTLILPTGDADKLTGSGATGFDIAASGSWQLGERWSATLGTAFFQKEDADLIGFEQENSGWRAGASLGWQGWSWLQLRAQLDAHSALYGSDLVELGDDAVLLSLGGRATLSRNWDLDLVVVEDLAVDTAPDVALQMALRGRY